MKITFKDVQSASSGGIQIVVDSVDERYCVMAYRVPTSQVVVDAVPLNLSGDIGFWNGCLSIATARRLGRALIDAADEVEKTL